MGKGKGGYRGGGRGGGGRGGGKADGPDVSDAADNAAAPPPAASLAAAARPSAPMPKLSERFAEDSGKGSSSMTDSEQDGFLELAKQLADLARAETASHEALTKRVTELETALAASRKDLADVLVRNKQLTTQLKAAVEASAKAAAAVERSSRLTPTAASKPSAGGEAATAEAEQGSAESAQPAVGSVTASVS